MTWAMSLLQREALRERMNEGVRAMVLAYYDNYTDADALDPEFYRLLHQLGQETGDMADVDECIVAAERTLSLGGGIVSETDGTRHQVHTDMAWDAAGEESPKYHATHVSVHDGSDAMLIDETSFSLVNEDGYAWAANPDDWMAL